MFFRALCADRRAKAGNDRYDLNRAQQRDREKDTTLSESQPSSKKRKGHEAIEGSPSAKIAAVSSSSGSESSTSFCKSIKPPDVDAESKVILGTEAVTAKENGTEGLSNESTPDGRKERERKRMRQSSGSRQTIEKLQ